MDKIKEFLRAFCASLATAKMYPMTHPQAREVVNGAYQLLQEVLKERNELIIGIVEDEIVFDKEVMFDVNAMLQLIIVHAKKIGIEKIHFLKRIQKEELTKFITFLLTPQEKELGNLSDHLVMLGITNVKVSSLTTPDEVEKKDVVRGGQYYQDFLKELPSYYDKMLAREPIPSSVYLELKFALFNLMDNLRGKHYEFLYLDSIRKYDQVLPHSLNVCLLAVHLAASLGFPQEDRLDIGMSALFHDIGRVYRTRLAADARGQKKEAPEADSGHAQLGAKLLLIHEETLGALPAIVAHAHHRKYHDTRGEGIPHPPKAHIASLIIAVCDCYDTLCRRWTGGQDYSPKRIYEMLQKNKDSFHPALLKKFIKVMGVWPVGTIVALNDGRIAVVREESEADVLCPKVEVIVPEEDRGQFIDLRESKSTVTIARALNPFTQGQAYFDLL